MGDYTLLIHGTGSHHNTKPAGEVHHADSDQLLRKFVKELKDNGHRVEVATITHGGRESVLAD